MEPAIEKCKWPPLPEHYSAALRDAVEFILTRFHSVTGIVAAGTIIRGIPSPSSDLDVYVVQTDSFRQRIQRFSKEVPTEIFVNPPSMIRKYFAT
jgi:predicted nucleotidyltransferase